MFKVSKYSFIFVLLLSLVIAVFYFLFFYKETKEPVWDSTRIIRYGFTLQNNSSMPLQNIIFKTYSPLVLSSSQKLIEITSPSKFTKHKDEFENQEIWFDVDFIPPYGKKRISITAKLLLSSVIAGAANEDKIFVFGQSKIESESSDVIKLSDYFSEKYVSEKPDSVGFQKTIYDWQVDNISYTGYGSKDKGAVYALTNLEGDCTEFAYLNVALNRALGVPSRAVNGYVIDHDSKLHASEYHTWSEVWFDNGWQVVDAQRKEFMTNQQNYIAMNIVLDGTEKDNKFKRFWVSNSDIVVTMN